MPHLSKMFKKQRLSFQTLQCTLRRPTKIWNHAKHKYKFLSRPWVIHRKCNLWFNSSSNLPHTSDAIKTVSLNFALLFAKAAQNMKSCKKHVENIEQAFSYTKTMPLFAQNSLIYPKLQHSIDYFNKLWIVICKSLSKY